MHNTYEILENIHYIGASDRITPRFENMIPLKNGIAYNSYMILDEKTAVLDTVDNAVSAVFIENIEYLLKGRTLDYLIINHMEPDHCANIEAVVRRYPDVCLVGNSKTFKFLEQFYHYIPTTQQLVVKDKDCLSLGKHELEFHLTPLVHWPEVMVSFEKTTSTLFSSDAFGSFGALNGNLFSDTTEFDVTEFRRYYTNIIGKFGNNVQLLLKKINQLQPKMIASLHGLIHRDIVKIEQVIRLYNQWSSYTPEKQGVVIVYASMYGNTAEVCNRLAMELARLNVEDIKIYDVSNTDASYIIADVFKYSNLVIASANYNTKLYFPLQTLLDELTHLNIQNRKVSFINNVSWGGTALSQAKELILKNKNMIELGNHFEIKSSMAESQIDQLQLLATEIVESL